MGKFPIWHRPGLAERQLVGEEKRLALRGLTAEQVRADLIRAAGHHEGTSRNARLRGLADSIEISEAYPDNVLAGRLPIGDALLIALYGQGRGSSMPMAWTGPVADWGPMLVDAIACRLVDAETAAAAGTKAACHQPDDTNSGAGDSFPAVAPAPVAAAPPPMAAAELPAASQTTSPAPELGADLAKPPAHVSDLSASRAASDAASQGGEGETAAAGGAAHPPLRREVTAGEGSRPDGAALPPSLIFTGPPVRVECAFDPALDELAQLAQRAAADVQRIEAEMAAAGTALVAAREIQTRARQAYDLLDELRREQQRVPAVAVAA